MTLVLYILFEYINMSKHTLKDYIVNPKSGLPILATPERLLQFSQKGITPEKLNSTKYHMNPITNTAAEFQNETPNFNT